MIKLMPLVKEIYNHSLNEDEMNELDIKGTARKLAIGTALGAATMFGSPKASAQIQPHQTTINSTSNKTSQPTEQEIKKFIMQRDWIRINKNGDKIYINFHKDGVFFTQEGFGEESMDEGKWKLNGNKLTIIRHNYNTDQKIRKKEYTIKIKKGKTTKEDQIILNDKIFHSEH